MALFGSGSGSAAQPNSPQEIKNAIIRQLQQEAAMANARSLIGVCPLSIQTRANSNSTQKPPTSYLPTYLHLHIRK